MNGGPEAIEEMMVVMDDGDPIKIFTRYKEKMEKFLKVNPGSRSHIYSKFTFPNYSTNKLGKIFQQNPRLSWISFFSGEGYGSKHVVTFFSGL